MKNSIYKDYAELPLFLNADTAAKTLGVSPASGYELLHENGFPTLRLGSRIVVLKEGFIRWVEEHTGGAG
ncbi:MAG: helix-turn-helix domain-containing protein [Oscillospiraceae bacterium]|nr:helix-turn-helix domain-containing protein [Oscillospiraceae bacterium]